MESLTNELLAPTLHAFSLKHQDTLVSDMDRLQEFQQIWPYLDDQMDLDEWEDVKVEVLEDGSIHLKITTYEFNIDIDYNPAYLDIIRMAKSFALSGTPGKNGVEAEPFVIDILYPSIWVPRPLN